MIELGLARIGRLLQHTTLRWRAIHVAGTNGKGSVCAYISAMLNSGNIKCGRFTSPHLIDRWDCITINEETVKESLFLQVEAQVKLKDKNEDIRASEFELLTATAFEIFAQENVDVGVVEVGLGGRLDATNILQNPMVTVITRIGKDHQSFLGHSLEEIALQKAGIMKEAATCVVDGTNPPSVLQVLETNAQKVKAGPVIIVSPALGEVQNDVWRVLSKNDFEHHQQTNICLALEAVKNALYELKSSQNSLRLLPAVLAVQWPGRLQRLSLKLLTGRQPDILLDGAHNAQSAEVLGSFVKRKLRTTASSVTWVIAFSQGKVLQELLAHLIEPGDNVVAVSFGPVAGMPWVQPTKVEDILNAVQKTGKVDHVHSVADNVEEALRWATTTSDGGPLVVAGSLYLVSDVLRLLRDIGDA
ncbi:folylpolyglutamate synthase [Toensbergia leucococca]|nr:folylpolyglutamate synthase [Toensbergia leucococca]